MFNIIRICDSSSENTQLFFVVLFIWNKTMISLYRILFQFLFTVFDAI